MIVSINQPSYLPWPGYFDRIVKSDVHVVLDCVQFEKGSYTNRNWIMSKNGPLLLTMPVLHQSINDKIVNKSINNSKDWQKKHILSISQSYSKSPYYKKYITKLQNYYNLKFDYLGDALREGTNFFMRELSVDTPLLYCSEMDVSGSKSNLILNICKSLGASIYISGPFGRNYLNYSMFKDEGIEIVYHEFNQTLYNDLHDINHPNFSIIDLMFNYGSSSKDFITGR